MRVGILGGTFDPVHIGHLMIAQEMMVRCELDEVIFLPAGEPPHKQYAEMASAHHRAEMVQLATEDNAAFSVSRFEIERSGKSYTVETLRALRDQMGASVALHLIIGADNAVDMRSWCNPEGVLQLAHTLVAERPGFDRAQIDPALSRHMRFVQTPLLAISSTEIRARVQAGLPIRYWVSPSVAAYIDAQHLYRSR